MRLLLLIPLLLACDREIGRDYGQPVTTREQQQCNKTGYCYDCYLDIMGDGHLKCGFHFSTMCSGKQMADVTRRAVYAEYESGRREAWSEIVSVRPLGACQ